ncbi:MAG: class I SAM-dependent methyltransferase [Phycisphaerales bacterium]|nr:class I SAM-dependent methyltransferase [Phycisphaerales bacterium]MCB9858613.1 class I SAM-dependent methyltransferase [Phycisphaerales bacterium]
MSAHSSEITGRHFAYIAERTIREDAFLAELKEAAAAADIPQIWIAPEQAALMRILLQIAGAKRVVEVGTLAGYSAIAMARALPPTGRVKTIEISEKHAEFARTWIAKSNVAEKIDVTVGAGMDVLPTLATDSADAIFLDADKSSYPEYLAESIRIVRRGGLIMVDNALAFGQLFDQAPTDPEVPAVKAFNEIIASDARLESVIVPIGDGLWVGVNRA